MRQQDSQTCIGLEHLKHPSPKSETNYKRQTSLYQTEVVWIQTCKRLSSGVIQPKHSELEIRHFLQFAVQHQAQEVSGGVDRRDRPLAQSRRDGLNGGQLLNFGKAAGKQATLVST